MVPGQRFARKHKITGDILNIIDFATAGGECINTTGCTGDARLGFQVTGFRSTEFGQIIGVIGQML